MARSLTFPEKELIRWMLEHGRPEASAFLPQLEQSFATDWRCPCGCASINLSVLGAPEKTDGLHIIADFLCGGEADLSGIFVYEKQGFLAGLEVYGAPRKIRFHDATAMRSTRMANSRRG
jgi:hypothetical protein